MIPSITIPGNAFGTSSSSTIMILDFGKYKGSDMEDVPLAYMVFLAGYRMQGSNRERSDLKGCTWVQLHKKEFHEFAREYLASKCWHCGGKLVPVGGSRVNGAAHEDWDGRYLYKKCWRELKTEENDHDDC